MSRESDRLRNLPWHEPAIAEAADALDAKDAEIARLKDFIEELKALGEAE